MGRTCMKRAARLVVDKVLALRGLRLLSSRTYERDIKRYESLVNEMHDCLTQTLWPELQPNSNRVPMLTRLVGTGVSEAMFIVSALHHSLDVDGDVCEFGVAQGATSALLANEIKDKNRELWLFDSFEGLPAPGEKDVLIDDIFNLGSIEKYEGTMACEIGLVSARLSEIGFQKDRIHVVPGFIVPGQPVQPFPESVCFAYVDFDFYEPVLAALDLLDSVLTVGGSVIVDDYGRFSQGAQAAVDEFILKVGARYELSFPPPFAGHFCIISKAAG